MADNVYDIERWNKSSTLNRVALVSTTLAQAISPWGCFHITNTAKNRITTTTKSMSHHANRDQNYNNIYDSLSDVPESRICFASITSLWEDLEAKLLTPGQLLGYPWKVWGITVQTSYVEGRWHQNWVRSRPTVFFIKATWKFVKKGNFL